MTRIRAHCEVLGLRDGEELEELGVELKIELQALGVHAAGIPARSGGAGPADGITLLSGDRVASVPTGGLYVSDSPYSVEASEGGMTGLCRDGSLLCGVEIVGEPMFVREKTPGGLEFGKIVARHGRDAVGSTVVQWCAHGRGACLFCAIDTSRMKGATTAEKYPGDLALAAAAAGEEGYSHFVLTTGTTSAIDAGIPHLEECAAAIKSATDMEVHVQFEPPRDLGLIDRIARVSDSAAINIESFDEVVRARATPGKYATPKDRYVETWRRAVSAYGPGQVTSFLIVGLGESDRSIIEGAGLLSSLGVYPFIVPLRPLRGTPVERLRPPGASRMTGVYEEAASVVEASGLKAWVCRAGCVRCGACSAFTDLTG